MSKSLNFVVNTRLDKRSSDSNGNHPIKLRVWNRASKQAKLYSCNKFTDEDSFNRAMDHKSTVKGDVFKLRLFLERVIANCSEVLEQHEVNTFSDFEKYMFNRTQDASDISYYINRKIEECHKNQQYSSKDIYKGLNKLLEAFSGGKSTQIDYVIPTMKAFEVNNVTEDNVPAWIDNCNEEQLKKALTKQI